MELPDILVERDYDGYFEHLVRRWYQKLEDRGLTPKRKVVVINAGPWRPDAVSYHVSDDGEVLSFDFYSALRSGFGNIPEKDVETIITNLL